MSDLIMLILVLLTLAGSLSYARKRKSWVVGLWALPLGYLAVYYTLHCLNLTWFEDDADLRERWFRPGLGFLLAFVTIFLLNGRVNDTLDKLALVAKNLWKKSS